MKQGDRKKGDRKVELLGFVRYNVGFFNQRESWEITLFTFLKKIWWQLRDSYGRFYFFNGIWRMIPGGAGEYLREKNILPYCKSAGNGVVIQEGVRFSGIHNLSVGNRVNIAADCFLQATGGLTLEDEVMLGPGVNIWTVNHLIDDINVPILDQGYESESVFIGKGCWLAANVFVMPGVELPEGCVVAANSVVAKKKYPPYSILAGFPARKIGTRKTEESK